MAKAKISKRDSTIPNKVLHCRISYLYQAAMYFATLDRSEPSAMIIEEKDKPQSIAVARALCEQKIMPRASQSISRRLVSDLRHVSLKAQIRMSPFLKHSMCKRCNTTLVDDTTCTVEIENKSKKGKKPWAEILVRKCNVCGAVFRSPVSALRQKRRPFRSSVNNTLQGCVETL